MGNMFYSATAFNQPLSTFDTSKVTDVRVLLCLFQWKPFWYPFPTQLVIRWITCSFRQVPLIPPIKRFQPSILPMLKMWEYCCVYSNGNHSDIQFLPNFLSDGRNVLRGIGLQSTIIKLRHLKGYECEYIVVSSPMTAILISNFHHLVIRFNTCFTKHRPSTRTSVILETVGRDLRKQLVTCFCHLDALSQVPQQVLMVHGVPYQLVAADSKNQVLIQKQLLRCNPVVCYLSLFWLKHLCACTES